ncbi:MAG: preQ(1) synthase [Chloroflexota bacterium]|nr:preQ(1) synthase [Chloroflexota bacterium]
MVVLGAQVREPVKKLDTFPRPEHTYYVSMQTDEVTSLCPVTGQPDWYTVRIEYGPDELCIESKSLKLYLWSFREEGHFCEKLADIIATDVQEQVRPRWVEVTVIQKPRGGISIDSRSRIGQRDQG